MAVFSWRVLNVASELFFTLIERTGSEVFEWFIFDCYYYQQRWQYDSSDPLSSDYSLFLWLHFWIFFMIFSGVFCWRYDLIKQVNPILILLCRVPPNYFLVSNQAKSAPLLSIFPPLSSSTPLAATPASNCQNHSKTTPNEAAIRPTTSQAPK